MTDDIALDEWNDAVPRNPGGRPRVFSDQVLAQIPAWIAEGWPLPAIAARLGTTEISLYTSCSKYGISIESAKAVGSRRNPKREVKLPKGLVRKLELRAAAMGSSVENLAVMLLEQIVADDLFNAILDFETNPQTQ